jgi:catechol 2,3-dioxygenase-like lactoylglutathione lyase family enzyme
MLDHVGLSVASVERSRRFYVAALAPLGIKVLLEVTPEMSGGGTHLGFGGTFPFFWIGSGGKPSPGSHIAFTSPDRKTVDAFYHAALAAGGKDNGAPGPRPQYHAQYYGAFIIDPDGYNIEAVCHKPQ